MWVILGILAIIATAANLILYFTGKDNIPAMAAALSLTALTLCAEHTLLRGWVLAEDWGALSDVVPGMTGAFWFLTIVSILLNITPIIHERKTKTAR